MWDYVTELAHRIGTAFRGMDRQQWIMVFFAALIIGFFCLRGFGSRTDY